MLLSEIIYNIKNLMAGGIESDDEDLSNAQLAFIIGYYRAKLLKQDQEKGRFDKALYVQNLGKVPVQEADKNECCDIDACILRTATQIPKPLETFDSINLKAVEDMLVLKVLASFSILSKLGLAYFEARGVNI